MVQVPKCRSQKHARGGCGDPRCPEGLYIEAALEQAAQSGDLKEYFEARDRYEITQFFEENGFGRMWVKDKEQPSQEPKLANVVLKRPALNDQVDAVDKTNIPSFETLDQLKEKVTELYGNVIVFATSEHRNANGWYRVNVDAMKVPADLRGLGVGTHIRQMLLKFSDETGAVISGTPTTQGDLKQYEPPYDTEAWFIWREKAKQHRSRLAKFYIRHGYEYNRCSKNDTDPFSGRRIAQSRKWKNQFSKDAKVFLAGAGDFVYFPNKTIPTTMLRRPPKQR